MEKMLYFRGEIMKKISILLVIMILVLFTSVNTLGAIQSLGDSPATIDRWYSTEPDAPYFLGNFYGVNQGIDSIQILNFEIYKNDQTFINYNYNFEGPISTLNLSGSFLFNSGFFIGVRSTRIEDHSLYLYGQQTILSPGYRAAIDENSYLAVSFDFVSNRFESKIFAYDISGKIFTEGFKITGDYSFYPDTGQMYAALGGNLVVSEHIIAGLDIDYLSENYITIYTTGLTYAGEALTVDGQTGYTSEYTDYFYSINGVFNVSESLHFGASYTKYNQVLNGCLILKAQFGGDDSKFVLKYNSANNNYYEALTLAYEHKFDK